jgi:hypothetical protein
VIARDSAAGGILVVFTAHFIATGTTPANGHRFAAPPFSNLKYGSTKTCMIFGHDKRPRR